MKKTMVRALSLLLAVLMMGSVIVLSANAADEVVSIKVKDDCDYRQDFLVGTTAAELAANLEGLVFEVTTKKTVDGQETTDTKDYFANEGGFEYTFDSSSAGTNIDSAKFGGKTTTFQVKFFNATELNVTKKPTKTFYEKGKDQELNLAGLQLEASYTNDNGEKRSKVVTDTSECEFSGFEPKTLGKQQITVTFQNATTSFEVNVVEVVGIEVQKKHANKDITYKAGEEFKPKDIKVLAHFTGELLEPEEITEGLTYDYDKEAFKKAGDVKITVTYNDNDELTAKYMVKVIDLAKIEVKDNPKKTEYSIGEGFDKSGMTLTAYYTDGTNSEYKTETITKGFTWDYADNDNFVNPGFHDIIIYYADKTEQQCVLSNVVEVVWKPRVRKVTAQDISMLWGTTTVVQPVVEGKVGMEYDIEYSAADESIVKVNPDGKVIARGWGKTTIKVSVWEKVSVYDKDGKLVQEVLMPNAETCYVDVTVKFTPIPWIYNSLFAGVTEFLVECVIYHIPFLYKLITK